MNDEFSSIATEKLLRLFPELSPYIINFSDVTDELARENDDTRVGMFICQLGGKAFYIPIVGKGNVVQSIDSLFDPEAQEFTPLTKQMIQQLINSQPQIGKPSRIPATVTQNPSVYGLVVPPRTGKLAYAGGSRFVELLAASPDMVKKAFVEQIKANQPFADVLNKTFDLADIFKALQPTGSSASTLLSDKDKDLIQVITGGDGLSESEVQSILDKGYAMRGIQKETRIAVPALDYNRMGEVTQIGGADVGNSFDIVMSNGETREGFLIEQAKEVPQHAMVKATLLCSAKSARAPFLTLFSNGDYCSSSSMVASGVSKSGADTLRNLFTYSPPITAMSVASGMPVLVMNDELKSITSLYVNRVEIHSAGVKITGYPLIDSGNTITVHAFRNCSKVNAVSANEIFVPFNTTFIVLGKNVSMDLETNVVSAQAKTELRTMMSLGSMSTIGFDGTEYSYNGKAVGGVPSVMKVLVMDEGINPFQAEDFVKKASENKFFKFYMSKQADYAPAEIPQYGNTVDGDQSQYDFGANLVGNTMQAAAANDSQVLEATLLSELVQAPNMNEYIQEYLPEIKAGMDKLGRVLFLIKVNMSKMFNGENASEIFSLVGNLRNVYRLLGDNYIKLERLGYNDTAAAQLQEQAV